MASAKQTREPSWVDVMAWVDRIERDHACTVTIMQHLRADPRAEAFKAAVVVNATAGFRYGAGAQRAARTGTFPSQGARSMTALILNLLFQLDNALCFQEADALEQQNIV